MPIRILVVDDSGFFCQQLTSILNNDTDMKVVGIASNGQDAIEKVKTLSPDVVTMDVEMPVMDGITAVKHIMDEFPVPVLMLSSLTYEGAKLTLDALAAGAVDFQLKSYESLSAANSASARSLREKVKAVAAARIPGRKISGLVSIRQPSRPTVEPGLVNVARRSTQRHSNYKVLLIGSSTGGPVVVQKILSGLPATFPLPIIVIQHMPSSFTGAFASRLNGICQLSVLEAEDNSPLLPGTALIAPGGKQIYFEKNGSQAITRIKPEDPRVNYQPCIDISFASAAKTFNSSVLALVLTGMGADGKDGAKLLKQKNSQVWAQNESSCVVYGMPMAVVNAGLADKVLDADEFTSQIIKEITA
ncbi:MAG TPA: chemotaxis response regulator protein-glutamate methylesterase [Aeromonadales bacterium]|nr:chemotaxis response regulator protein-glutamate methylesterase [Aeromonadales bacterium]